MSSFKNSNNKKYLEKRNRNLASLTFDVLRVRPEEIDPQKNPNSDRLSDLLIMLFIFGIAVWVRFWALGIVDGQYGDSFRIIINERDTLGIGNYLGVNPGTQIETEGYSDYDVYYIDYVNAFVDVGWNPYSGKLDPNDPEDVLNGYVYGPIYIYSITIGKLWFGQSAENSIIWSNILFDAGTYVMVYILAKRVTGNIVAMIVAVLGSFSPIAIYYASVRVLNAPAMNFLTLVFLYFFLEHRDGIAMFFLAAATLTKQFPLFLLMPIGFFMVRRYGFLKGVAIYLLFFVFVILLSVPWILLTPQQYIIKLFLPGGGKDVINCPQGGEATNLVHAELDLDACDKYYQSENLADVQISDFGNQIFNLVNGHIVFGVALLLISLVGLSGYDYMEKNPKRYYQFYAAFFGIAHATIARGIYKYYLTFLIPLFILAFIPGNVTHSMNLRLGANLNRAWNTWINPKYRVGQITKEYWLFFFALVASTVGILWLVHLAVSMFTTPDGFYNVWMFIFSLLAILFILKPGHLTRNELGETLHLTEFKKNDSVLLIIFFIIAYGFKLVASQYFGDNTESLRKISIRLLLLLLLFIYLPLLQNKVTKTNKLLPYININISQLIMDMISLVIIFFVINLFHIEIILVHRFYTTTVVLGFSIFIMGLLGSEVWGSYFRIYVNAIKKFRKVYEYS